MSDIQDLAKESLEAARILHPHADAIEMARIALGVMTSQVGTLYLEQVRNDRFNDSLRPQPFIPVSER